MYVRVKRIRGNDYAYLVHTRWTAKGPRQRVSQYLGKLIRAEKVRDISFKDFLGEEIELFIKNNTFEQIIPQLVRWELEKHGLTEQVTYKSECLEIKKRAVTIAIGDGYLCKASIKKMQEYVAEDDYTGFILADRLTAAGIHIEKEVFVALFEKLQQKIDDAEQINEKIYY